MPDFGQSSIRKMATHVLPTDLTQMMQMLMQEREERKLEREAASENARLEREAARKNARLEREAAERKEERRLEREAKERETASENAKLEREAAKENARLEREAANERSEAANARYDQLMQGMIEMQRANKDSIERAADKQMADRAQQIEREGEQEAHL